MQQRMVYPLLHIGHNSVRMTKISISCKIRRNNERNLYECRVYESIDDRKTDEKKKLMQQRVKIKVSIKTKVYDHTMSLHIISKRSFSVMKYYLICT